VNLILRDVRRDPSDDRYVWTPYELNEEFNGDWWDSPPYSIDDRTTSKRYSPASRSRDDWSRATRIVDFSR